MAMLDLESPPSVVPGLLESPPSMVVLLLESPPSSDCGASLKSICVLGRATRSVLRGARGGKREACRRRPGGAD